MSRNNITGNNGGNRNINTFQNNSNNINNNNFLFNRNNIQQARDNFQTPTQANTHNYVDQNDGRKTNRKRSYREFLHDKNIEKYNDINSAEINNNNKHNIHESNDQKSAYQNNADIEKIRSLIKNTMKTMVKDTSVKKSDIATKCRNLSRVINNPETKEKKRKTLLTRSEKETVEKNKTEGKNEYVWHEEFTLQPMGDEFQGNSSRDVRNLIAIDPQNYYRSQNGGSDSSLDATPYGSRGDGRPVDPPPPPLVRTHAVIPNELQHPRPAGNQNEETRERAKATAENRGSGREKSNAATVNLELFNRQMEEPLRRISELLEDTAKSEDDINELSNKMVNDIYEYVKYFIETDSGGSEKQNVFVEKLSEGISSVMKDVEKYAEDLKSLPTLLQKELSAAEAKMHAASEGTSAPDGYKQTVLTKMKLEALSAINLEIWKNADFHVEALVKQITTEKLEKYRKIAALMK